MDYKQYISDIKMNLESGKMQWRRGDKLLAAFGYVRRRQTFVDLINAELAKCGIVAVPPITTGMNLDGYTRFLLPSRIPAVAHDMPITAGQDVEEVTVPPREEIEAEEKADLEELPLVAPGNPADLALTVSNLECSERLPLCIKPQETLAAALTLMQLHDYSQLVVASGPRSVKGLVSYKSIARAQLHGRPERVSECIDETVPRVKLTTPLIQVIANFQRQDAVLVFGSDNSICGIVTAADIALEFSNMASPFLVIGEIEQHLRWLIHGIDIVDALKGSSPPNGEVPALAGDLTMGELQRILQRPDIWSMTGIKYDRTLFCTELDAIRSARNALMHFREPLDDITRQRLQSFADLLRNTCEQLANQD